MSKNVVTLKSGQRSLKIIGTDTYRSATYDSVLTFNSNHWAISHRFRTDGDFNPNRQFSPTPCILPPAEGVRLGIGYRRMESKNYSDGATW